MSKSIVSYDVQSLIDQWLELEKKGEQFPVDFDIAWQIAGYAEKGKGKRRLISKSSGLIEGEDYLIDKGVLIAHSGKSTILGRSRDAIVLSCDAFKHFCLLAQTEEGRQIRQYFIEAEKNWRMVQSVAPEFAQQIELEKIRLELERERNRGKELDSTMIQLHGDRIVLALRGKDDVIVEKETIITEVVNPSEGTATKILSADQLKRAVKDRTGQRIKTAKEFTESLRKKGRDDLLVPVTRSQTCEYVAPDKLEEAIAVVFGKCRQKLIGE